MPISLPMYRPVRFVASIVWCLLATASYADDDTAKPVSPPSSETPPVSGVAHDDVARGTDPSSTTDSDILTFPNNKGHKINVFTSLLSFLGLPEPGKHARPGVSYTTYTATDNTIRNLFGNQWTLLGPGFGRLAVPKPGATIDADINLLTSSKDGNRIILVPLGATWSNAFGDSRTRPFVGFGGGMLFAETRIRTQNLPTRVRGGLDATAFAGVAFGGSGSVRLGYRWAERVRGLNLSGTSLDLAVRF